MQTMFNGTRIFPQQVLNYIQFDGFETSRDFNKMFYNACLIDMEN